MLHAYPHDLAVMLRELWDSPLTLTEQYRWLELGPADPLPALAVLEHLLSTCYQASLLRDEERPVRFRLLLREPERLPPEQGPPTGLHRLIFTQPRPCNVHELRRLSPAVDFYRALIGVSLDAEQEPYIWGLAHSGPSWIHVVQGSRRVFHPLPTSLVVSVTGPGYLTVGQGSLTIGKLAGGRLATPSTGVFESRWLRESFGTVIEELLTIHTAARQQALTPWAPLAGNLGAILMQRLARQVVSAVRNTHHGGMLLILPPELTADFTTANRYLTLKYPFSMEEPRYRLRTVLAEVMNTLAESCGESAATGQPVGWYEYLTSTHPTLARLDEAMTEIARLIAGLTAVDGAVLLTNHGELLGFGAEISGELDQVPIVARALDVEGQHTYLESTASVGTRHRSAYRLCNALHNTMAIVVSQDDNVQFVKWKDGLVTYWDQVATSTLDV